jgi:hypothetical protein
MIFSPKNSGQVSNTSVVCKSRVTQFFFTTFTMNSQVTLSNLRSAANYPSNWESAAADVEYVFIGIGGDSGRHPILAASGKHEDLSDRLEVEPQIEWKREVAA